MPQATRLASPNVFLDTSIWERENFNYSGPKLGSLCDLAVAGRVRPVTTSITTREVVSHIKQKVDEACAQRPKSILKNSQLPEVMALFRKLEPTEVTAELAEQFDTYLRVTSTITLDIPGAILGSVLDDYFDRRPPFEDKKKSEFPDGFVLHTLRRWCEDNGQDLAVVSADAGMLAACDETGCLRPFNGLAEFLNAVNDADEALTAFFYERISRSDGALALLDYGFDRLGFGLVDVEGEVTFANLMDVEFDGDIEVVSLKAHEASVQLSATFKFEADIEYIAPGTSLYDKEDGVTFGGIVYSDKVVRTVRRDVGVELRYDGLDPKQFEMVRMWVADAADIEIESYPSSNALRDPRDRWDYD